MTEIDWNMVSALANIVMATTAVVAAWYALRQFRASVKTSELEQILAMYSSTAQVMANNEGKEFDRDRIREAMNLLETHERLIAHGLLSKTAASFYRDAVSINEDITSIPDNTLALIRDVLSNDPRGYRHLIASLRKNEVTRYIINW